ncbi:MAG TPA: ATP phosphoribosyltransferase regulatory subunit [Thioalkalivibrio sp.]|nr:ATP phosphoribosyltransferase regulatory subunit [Thioalkalivibrio sp.]
MTNLDHWLLPEGIDEALPDEAERLEAYRRRLIDLYHAWGYELVMPPFIEYLESLLTGTGHDLDLKTFKLTDQLTGRMMGVRADMTPQVARIDAHRLGRTTPTRLCYLGTVLNTRSDGFGGTRSPLQVGAELYGHAGIDSDIEIIALMLETLRATGVRDVYVDLGHVGVFRSLVRDAGLSDEQEAAFFDMLQRKSIPEINEFLAGLAVDPASSERLRRLAEFNGDAEVIDVARELFGGAAVAVGDALDYLAAVVAAVQARFPDVALHVDLAELRGYHYHTGVVFTAYVPGEGQEVARGGRYDEIGKVFGRARPATGFSADLKTLARLSCEAEEAAAPAVSRIFAPAGADAATVAGLRAKGERVVQGLAGQTGDARSMGCDRELVESNGQWTVVDIK